MVYIQKGILHIPHHRLRHLTLLLPIILYSHLLLGTKFRSLTKTSIWRIIKCIPLKSTSWNSAIVWEGCIYTAKPKQGVSVVCGKGWNVCFSTQIHICMIGKMRYLFFSPFFSSVSFSCFRMCVRRIGMSCFRISFVGGIATIFATCFWITSVWKFIWLMEFIVQSIVS